jgi:hypothetical protein
MRWEAERLRLGLVGAMPDLDVPSSLLSQYDAVPPTT